ncbi:ATP-binding cassette domain-containing protein [Cytobacillus purgationiresistens]|uniref:ABC-type multidrug transport system ATPase subunit n=1 Tax=Cytobacillus purgationiresistens TaxID=863449 RepID=A0ABU0AHA3_9BACI|nr:ATP-binding cassette domain-containing protein [Cytobacillus purgationiresistens]MDQ0270646.1 ABC-type multidrug transport system ATPase subunit [Cytobacillus purgationiresistens]
MKIFVANQACKKIDGIMILKEVSITISQGEKVAITGSNGSGKSSLLKLIGGIFEETAGQVKRSQINIGYVPEHFPENIRFKLQDYLMIMGKMTCKSEEGILKRIENYAELFAITDFLSTPLNHCSKGTKQKAGIIQALLKKPDLLLLDEPLTGLDDKAKIALLNQLISLQKEKTVIFTAHDPLLVEGLADRVLTVEGGRIVHDSTKNKKEKLRFIRAKIPAREVITGIPCIRHEFVGEGSVEIIVSTKESDKILVMLLERGCSILELTERR